MQFVFDNADVNVCTLDGLDTFHALGGIKCIAPATAVKLCEKIQRTSITQNNKQKHNIPIHIYKKKLTHQD